MTTTEPRDPVTAAVTSLDGAHRRALDLAAANPVSLALVRSYLADAILETTGREP